MDAQDRATAAAPATLAGLSLPPTFVADHCIRTLFYQGPLSPADLAKHWRVHPEIAFEVLESLKAEGLVAIDGGQAAYDRMSRLRLTTAGREHAEAARHRTWYAGALPVALADLRRRDKRPGWAATPDAVRDALGRLALEPSLATEIGQAFCAGEVLTVAGLAADEQTPFARALGRTLQGTVELPYATFAAGAVIRVFDARHHVTVAAGESDLEGDILRSREPIGQWITIQRPAVLVRGGVLPSDVVPAYDHDAKFYLASTPFAANGGMLAVIDADNSPPGLRDLTQLWLSPARHGVGIILLRSGERIEVPWRAAVVIFRAEVSAVAAHRSAATPYEVDVSRLRADGLVATLQRRLGASEACAAVAEPLAAALHQSGLATRSAAAAAATYITDRAAYDGASLGVTAALLSRAVEFAGGALLLDADSKAA